MIILDRPKICIKCGKLRFEFNTANVCILCFRLQKKLYKEKNKEKIDKQAKEYRKKNKEKIKQKDKRYRKENKKKLSKKSREYQVNNKEKIKTYRAKRSEQNKEYNKNYYKNNKAKIKANDKKHYEENREAILAKGKVYKALHHEELKKRSKKYYWDNRDVILSKCKQYYINNKDSIFAQINEYVKKRRKSDPKFKLRTSISTAVNQALKKRNSKKSGSILDFLPFSISELKSYLESLFEPWMNWNNWGKYSLSWDDNNSSTWTWNIDHIIPQSKLPYNSMSHPNFQKCWALYNLRPLSSKQNLLKFNKII